MKPTDKSDIAFPLSPTLAHSADHALMPGEFAGMYQAGYEAGYRTGREAGHKQGFSEGAAHSERAKAARAADSGVSQVPANGSALKEATERTPAAKHGPRRLLLGMPCKTCRVYFFSDETNCPCCKQPRVA